MLLTRFCADPGPLALPRTQYRSGSKEKKSGKRERTCVDRAVPTPPQGGGEGVEGGKEKKSEERSQSGL